MYNICFMTDDGMKGIVTTDTGQPIEFDDDNAWGFIQTAMQSEQHPLFMWVKEVPDADPGQCDHPLFDCP